MQSYESIAAVGLGKARVVVEDQAQRRRVGTEEHVGDTAFGDQLGSAVTIAGIGMAADVGVGPAVEFVLTDTRQVVGHQAVAQTIAFVDHDIELAALRLEGDADRIPETAGEGCLGAAVGGEALHRGPWQRLLSDVAAAAHGDEETSAIRSEGNVAGPMAAATAQCARGRHRLRPAPCLEVALFVGNAPKPRGFGDIEVAILERQAVGAVEAMSEGVDGFGPAVAVAVAQQRDAPGRRLGQKNVAIGRYRQPARMAEVIGKEVGAKAGRQPQRRPGRPLQPARGIACRRCGEGPRHVAGPHLEAKAGTVFRAIGIPGQS